MFGAGGTSIVAAIDVDSRLPTKPFQKNSFKWKISTVLQRIPKKMSPKLMTAPMLPVSTGSSRRI